jgi:RimJ/RimL family protein N-acetyltransferase
MGTSGTDVEGPEPFERPLVTERLVLRPMRPTDADDLYTILRDPAIDTWMQEAPPEDAAEVRGRIASWRRGPARGSGERWLNWLARTPDGDPVAHLSATVQGRVAWLAWIVAVERQRRGYATEAARAVAHHLGARGIDSFAASIPAGHEASEGVARNLGLGVTDELVDGERVWRTARR